MVLTLSLTLILTLALTLALTLTLTLALTPTLTLALPPNPHQDIFAANPKDNFAPDHCALIHLNEPCILENSRGRLVVSRE